MSAGEIMSAYPVVRSVPPLLCVRRGTSEVAAVEACVFGTGNSDQAFVKMRRQSRHLSHRVWTPFLRLKRMLTAQRFFYGMQPMSQELSQR